MRWLPGLSVLRQYDPAWLRDDLVAGLVMTTMLVPVGIAYAEASGVPGINGLYATIVPLLAYALFGPSRILVLGPDSSLAAVILAVVAPLSAGDPQRAVALAGAMAIVSGVVCVAAGLARLGFVTELLSKPIRYGYMNGIALTVMLSQIPKLLGFSVSASRTRYARRGESSGSARGAHQRRGIRDRRRHARAHPAAEALAARAGPPDRRRRRHARGRAGPISQRAPAWRCSVRCRRDCRRCAFRSSTIDDCHVGSHGRPRGRARVVRGHERAVAHLRGAPAHAGRPEPGDGGPRRRQPRGRLLPGLPDQQQLVADAGRRGGRARRPS